VPDRIAPEPDLADPLTWRPQIARRSARPIAVRDPVCEPHWAGQHVLLHVDATQEESTASPAVREPHVTSWIQLIDVDGRDVTDDDPDLTAEVAASILAADAVVDGWLTDQASRTGAGTSIAETVRRTPIDTFVSFTGRPPELIVPPVIGHDGEGRTAFVAVDLLRVDGQVLLDLPLLERKRLLEGVVRQSDAVRITPYTRPPLKPWLVSWQSAGFEGAILKAANSRYRPTTLSDEWAVITRMEGVR
jgi:hypothetical protein